MADALLTGLSRDYGVHAYGKWRGAFWRLLSLVDLGAERSPGASAAAEQVLAWLADPRRLARIEKRRIEGRFPPYWHYDVLVGLRTLAQAGALADTRTSDALDLLVSKRHPDGTWRTEGRWWKRPGSKGSNVEVVDWGSAADDLLTKRVRDVLTAAGRA